MSVGMHAVLELASIPGRVFAFITVRQTGKQLVSRSDSSRGESLTNRVTFLGFQTVKSGRVGNGRGDDAKTSWLLSLLPYRFSEI